MDAIIDELENEIIEVELLVGRFNSVRNAQTLQFYRGKLCGLHYALTVIDQYIAAQSPTLSVHPTAGNPASGLEE